MITERINVTSENDTGIIKAAEILKNGGIVAIPTETVYGLAADAFNPEAIKKVFLAKGRPQDNPLIVHIADISQIYSLCSEFPERAKKCAAAFWPGPFTMILPRNEKLPKVVSAGLDSVAIRMPSDKIANMIIKNSCPLAAPSANTSGLPSPTSPYHVINDLDGKIDAVVIAGDCSVGVESTVISLLDDKPRLLRPGGITAEQIREILPDLTIDPAVIEKLKDGVMVRSPGMKYKHYSPKTEVFMVEGDKQSYINFVNSKLNQDAVALCFDDEAEQINIRTLCYGMSNNDLQKAQELFNKLRKIDEIGAKCAYAHAPNKSGVGLAVYNRLIRASAFKVIKL